MQKILPTSSWAFENISIEPNWEVQLVSQLVVLYSSLFVSLFAQLHSHIANNSIFIIHYYAEIEING